jgi:hypothetical protein
MGVESDLDVLANLERAVIEDILRRENIVALEAQWRVARVRKREFYPHAQFTFFLVPSAKIASRAPARLTVGGYTFARLAGKQGRAAFTLHTDSKGKLSHLTAFMDDDTNWPSRVTGFEVYSLRSNP